jgi:diguanylate cyclase (GGDEF)-like protein
VKDTATVLLLIAMQQGLFALGWWVAGWRLGLSRRTATHWMVATLAAAMALSFIVQRGNWPNFITYALANVLVMGSFVTMRRGVQIFLRLHVTDTEHLTLMALTVAVIALYLSDVRYAYSAVIGTSALVGWTLLRTAVESYRALRRAGDMGAAHAVAAPMALLGLLYVARLIVALIDPELAARPLNEASSFNTGVLLVYMVVGLVLNLVLAYMVVNRLVRRLQHLSQRDALTGLLNRRALQPLLAREASRLRRYGETYALVMVDIDHFKAVNDAHGHAVGDAVLVSVAELLRRAAREVDQVARVGGEEFCLLLPHTDLDGAMQVARRTREAVRAGPWPELDHTLTISVGVAMVCDPDETPVAALARADAALYRAKDEGRDCVVLAEPLGGVLHPA